jgi:hypothetical protein
LRSSVSSATDCLRICTGIWLQNRIAFIDAVFSCRTENRIPVQFAANRTMIRTGIRFGLESAQNL